jgi:hypothetical protein
MKRREKNDDFRPSKPVRPEIRPTSVTSPRADGFNDGHRFDWTDRPEDPFDPERYKEIYAETD